MSRDPRVSFVVTSYNYGRYVAQTVDSLLRQTFEALEVVIVDDASTDDSLEVLARYSGDPRVRLIQHAENQGGDRSRNEGLSIARGEFIAVMDSDDFCLRPDAVARQVAVLDAHPEVGFVYSAFLVVDEQGQPIRRLRPWEADYVRPGLEEFADLVLQCYVQNSGTLVRRTCHAAVGGYEPSLPHTGDWDRWLRLASRYGVGYIAEPLYAWRMHRSNVTHSRNSAGEVNEEHLMVMERAFAALPADAPATVRGIRPLAVRRALLAHSAGAAFLPRTRRGWESLGDALRRSPGLVATPEFARVLARLLLLTVLGHRRYDRIVAWRNGRGAAPETALRATEAAGG